jgi:hypothetical protein
MCPSIVWWSRPPWHTGRCCVCAWWMCWGGERRGERGGEAAWSLELGAGGLKLVELYQAVGEADKAAI